MRFVVVGFVSPVRVPTKNQPGHLCIVLAECRRVQTKAFIIRVCEARSINTTNMTIVGGRKTKRLNLSDWTKHKRQDLHSSPSSDQPRKPFLLSLLLVVVAAAVVDDAAPVDDNVVVLLLVLLLPVVVVVVVVIYVCGGVVVLDVVMNTVVVTQYIWE